MYSYKELKELQKKAARVTLFGRHRGSSIWIAGSDPSLDTYPDDFLDDKTSIALHLTHLRFPNATYRYASEWDRASYLISADPAYVEQPLIAACPLYGRTIRETLTLFADFSQIHFHGFAPYPPNGVRGDISASFTAWKVKRTLEGKTRFWGAHGTCLHTAIYMAVLMGAAEIHLIGCGHGMYQPGQDMYAGAEGIHKAMRADKRAKSDPVQHVPMIRQTLALKEACEEAGIRFFWHREYSPSMDAFIEVNDVWLREETARADAMLRERPQSLTKRIFRYFVKKPLNRFIISRI